MTSYLDFEKPIAEIEGKLQELRHLSDDSGVNMLDEVSRLEGKVDRLLKQTYSRLTPWQKTLVARHQLRPHCTDYIRRLIDEFVPLAGDRAFGEDRAVIGGLGRFCGFTTMVIGQEKGADTEGRVAHNFGMANPEGYRKAARLLRLAERFDVPVLTLIDTPGAHPGVGAEERGQAEAIARCIEACLDVKVPVVALVIGEGGSGGAIALGVANQVLMLEHAIYSVISPEGCASILWRDAAHAETAAEALQLTSEDLRRLRVIDAIVPEPVGGAHRDAAKAIDAAGAALAKAFAALRGLDGAALRNERRDKFLTLGTATAT
jgi:acetyl-CoA carboxylase carboxyl transferase subunit alpha